MSLRWPLYPFQLALPFAKLFISLYGGSVVKNSLANAGNARVAGSIPGLGRYPGGGNVFLTGKSHAQRSLAAVRHNWAPKDQPYIHSNCPCLFRKTSSPLHRYIILKMYCSAIALQCVSSRCTTKWASYTCKYSHSFSFSRFFSHISCFRILSRVPCAQHQVLVSYLFYM